MAITLSASITSGCVSTEALLTKKPPENYLEVVQDGPIENVEAALKASGKPYVCKEFYAGKGSHENRRACFVKAPDESRYKELGVKLSELPRAILVDTGNTALVVGKVYLQIMMQPQTFFDGK